MPFKKLVLLLLFQASIPLFATNYLVTSGTDNAVDNGGNPGELRYVLNTILNDQAVHMTPTDRQITFASNVSEVSLNGILPMINLFQGDSTQINVGGNQVVINGNGYRPFFIAQGNDVTLENLVIVNAAATGGTGGTGGGGFGTNLGGGGGGGGMGAGGAIFVDSATVTLNNVSFKANGAVGGTGGTVTGTELGSGGGGGLGGNGGNASDISGAGGGGYSGNGGNSYGSAGGGGGAFGNGGDSGGASSGLIIGIGRFGSDFSSAANNGGGGGGGAIIGANGGSGDGGAGSAVAGFVFGGGGAGGSTDVPINGGAGGGVLAGTGGASNGGGGGGGYQGEDGDAGPDGSGGMGGIGGGGGGAAGNYHGNPGSGGVGGGGGGAGAHTYGSAGGYGGGGGGFGVGGFGGGGGGGSFGVGGFGGGGGGGDICFGGFGGGGGGGFGPGFAGLGGVGAGVGSTEFEASGQGGGGGGGAGFGGAIFLNTGTIIVQGQGFFVDNGLTPGAPGTPASIGGTTAGSDIFLVSGSGLTFAPGTDQTITLAGSIADDSSYSVPGGNGVTSGSGAGGSIVKNGAGTLSLLGNNTYIGGTFLNFGTLIVDGSIVAALNSSPNTYLRGTGSVGNVTLQGTIAPGNNSIGTMTASSINFESGSTLAIELNPSESSLLEVTGTANVSGPTVVLVSEDPGIYTSNTVYTVLEAGSPVTGTGNLTVQSVDPKFRFLLDTSIPNEVRLILQITRINTTFLCGNQLIVANYLNTIQDYTPLQDLLFDISSLPQPELAHALDTISPARNAAVVYATQNVAFTFNDIVMSRLNDTRILNRLMGCKCPCENNKTVWISGFGEFIYQSSQRQTPAFEIGTGGVVVGYDYSVNPNVVIGASLGYANINVHQEHKFGDQTAQDYIGTIYGSYVSDEFFLNLIVEGGYQKISSHRHIFFPGFDAKARSHTDGGQVTPHIDFGFDLDTCFCTIEPFASFDWAYNSTNKFKEHGAYPFDMEQKLHDSSLYRSEGGLSAYKVIACDWFGLMTIKGKVSYVNKIPFDIGKVTANIQGAGGSFRVNSLSRNQNFVAVGLQAVCITPSGWDFTLNYDGEYAHNYSTSTGFLKISMSF